MRGIHLPPLPAPPSTVEDCQILYGRRRQEGRMPFPIASQLLIAYMAWPNDRTNRDGWMATSIAYFFAQRERSQEAQSSGTDIFNVFGGLNAVADAALSHFMEDLEGIQGRWPRVADILHMVVDIHHQKKAALRGGASISKAMDVLLGYGALPRRSRLAEDWGQFRDVAHLIAAAASIAVWQRGEGAGSILEPVLLAPEIVLGIGLAFQTFGLSFRSPGQSEPLLPQETLWRIPESLVPQLPLPVREVSEADLHYLAGPRRARRKP